MSMTLEARRIGAGVAPPTAGAAPAPVVFNFTQTDTFAPLLKQLGVSLLVTTYQANKLLVLREQRGGLSILVRTFERPMGVAADARRIALGTREQIWQFRNAPDIAPQVEPTGTHDGCFIPRASHVTGDIGVHEIAWAGEKLDELWLVNTRFSCLCTIHPDYSFVPRWRPPFISALAAEDRCHLNGLGIVNGQPAYVTALGQTDTRGGWRAGKARGGVVISVPDGRLVAEGLCMPHSPRWHQGRLWVLDSGTGRLLDVHPATGEVRPSAAELPGFARGLGIYGHYAFIGLSKIRPTSAMDGVPLAERRAELKCGVAVIDLRVGGIVATVDFHTAVEEVFDVQVIAGGRFPEVLGFQKDTIQNTFVVPPVEQHNMGGSMRPPKRPRLKNPLRDQMNSY
ncbi:MAG TPA: TIGR03032 family protein [Tepidisphaeraceae bacterium]|nr:TIGR03032 family protein [Tepidisphaeraceae bacterium]